MDKRETRRKSLTAVAQQAVAAVLHDGARAVDATMGTGQDTLFLATRVAPSGRVIAFDIQSAAVTATRQRLLQAGLVEIVDLRQVGHQNLSSCIPADWPGTVSAVMFNLGYLPGGDKTCVTQATTTCAALTQAIDVLRPGGMLSLLLYRGHAGADPEVRAVRQWLARLPDRYRLFEQMSPGPVLYLVTDRAEQSP
jgi:predicted methyltransferase